MGSQQVPKATCTSILPPEAQFETKLTFGTSRRHSTFMRCYSLLPMTFLLISQALCVGASSCQFDEDPFTIWKQRLIYCNLKQLSVSLSAIDSAIHDYGQSSLCVWLIFRKALEGESIKMIVIGRSNSAGGGIPDNRQLYHQLFLHWWNSVILPCTGSKLIFENFSLGGTGSDFFSFFGG